MRAMSRPVRSPASSSATPPENGLALRLGAAVFTPQPSGALWRPETRLLAVADLHLGKSERLARRGGPFLPPYETVETLDRLGAEIERLQPRLVVSLGDAFDDGDASASLDRGAEERLLRLMAGRRWIWISGNHDPQPIALGGESRAELTLDGVVFRHEPAAALDGVEIAGHLHPKARLALRGRVLRRRCFLADARRAILPAFGAYTGGLDAADPVFDRLLGPEATAILCSGSGLHAFPRRSLTL